MQTRLNDIRALDGDVLAVSVDPIDKSHQIAEAYGLDYPLLSDPDLELIDAFGLRHPGASVIGDDIARPATFILDRNGQIVWRELTENWRIRTAPDRLLHQLTLIP